MPKVNAGRKPLPGLTEKTAETIRGAASRNGHRFDYQIGRVIDVGERGISERLNNGTFSHMEIVRLGKKYQFTEDEWRALGCR